MKNLLSISLVFILIGISCKSKVTNKETGATYKEVDVAAAKALIAENKDLIIIDVRTPEETEDGTIENAMTIDVENDNFESEVNKLDKSKSYLVYCRSGKRSTRASNKMIELGFMDITNMLGGYLAWNEEE